MERQPESLFHPGVLWKVLILVAVST